MVAVSLTRIIGGAQNTSCPGSSAIDSRTDRNQGYAKSINARRGIEKVFGWIKQWGGLHQFKLRGTLAVLYRHGWREGNG